jgi:hypothetical protein
MELYIYFTIRLYGTVFNYAQVPRHICENVFGGIAFIKELNTEEAGAAQLV